MVQARKSKREDYKGFHREGEREEGLIGMVMCLNEGSRLHSLSLSNKLTATQRFCILQRLVHFRGGI